MTGETSRTLRGLAWTGPFFAGFAVFMLLPAALSIFYAFTDYSVLEAPVRVGLDNFREMLRDQSLGQAVRNTVLFSGGAVLGSTIISIATAYLIERAKARGGVVAGLGEVTRTIAFAPTLVPIVAASLAWLWVLNTEKGAVNQGLRFFFDWGPDWIGSSSWALVSIILVSLWGVGSYIVIYGAAMRGVPASLYEAATLDGCGSLRRFFHVTLPMISPAVVLNVVMSIIWSLQAFAAPLIMTRGGPGNATLTYAMHVYNNAFVYGRMGYACALAWIQFLATLVLVGVFLKLSKRFVYARGA